MVTLFAYKGTFLNCNVLGGSRVRAVSDVVERRDRARPQAKRRGGGDCAGVSLVYILYN